MIENAEYKSHFGSLKVERIEISYHVETLRKCCVRLESMKLTRHELSLGERSYERVILNLNNALAKKWTKLPEEGR